MRPRRLLPTLLGTLLTTATLFALTGYQVTGATAATRLLSRLAGAIIEADRWLPAHLDDLDLLARDRPEGFVRVADLPISVALPARQVIGADEAKVRALLLEAMGDALYERGNDAFSDAAGKRHAPAVTEPVHWAVAFLGDGAHAFWRLALPLSLLLLVALAAVILQSGGSLLAMGAVGAGVGAMGSFATALLAGAASRALTSPVDREIALILRDGALIGLRDSLAVAVVAAGLVVLFRILRPSSSSWRSASAAPPETPLS